MSSMNKPLLLLIVSYDFEGEDESRHYDINEAAIAFDMGMISIIAATWDWCLILPLKSLMLASGDASRLMPRNWRDN